MTPESTQAELPAKVKSYARYLTTMAGLGGLLYGVDVGIIAAALPYIEATTTLTPSNLSFLVAAVLLGSVLSSLVAGMLAEVFGRKMMIIVSALLFTLSIPVICLSNGDFNALVAGRLLQGASAGLIGVVVPMYLAECLGASARGKGTGMFQFLLTVGLVFAAAIGLATTNFVGAATDVSVTDIAKTQAWQTIFWCSIVPGILLFFGAFRLKESPRWLYKRGRKEEALASLAANNGDAAAQEILNEMIEADAAAEREKAELAEAAKGDTILQRKYVIPFILAIVILGCNQATGINSVLNYSVMIFQQAGLEGESANLADFAIKMVNMLMTIVAVSLVDKKGRKFLLKMGTAGIIAGLAGVGAMFLMLENKRVDVTELVTKRVVEGAYMKTSVADVVKESGLSEFMEDGKVKEDVQLILTYQQGGSSYQKMAKHFDRDAEMAKVAAAGITYKDDALAAVDVASTVATMKEDILNDKIAEKGPKPLSALLAEKDPSVPFTGTDEEREAMVKTIQKLESNGDRMLVNIACVPKADFLDKLMVWSELPEAGKMQEVVITRAELGMTPSSGTGWMVTAFFVVFIAFYAAGPGVCVWLALSELMPTRIRANGMAIALLINQGVSTTIAGVFLPWVGSAGYAMVFFTLAGFTVIYFIAAAFFLPETKGRTLEEIEKYFSTGKMPKPLDEQDKA